MRRRVRQGKRGARRGLCAASLSLLGACGSNGPEFQVAIHDLPSEPLTEGSNDPLLLVEIQSFSGTFQASDLTVQSLRGSFRCAPSSGDAFLRAGAFVYCAEPDINLFASKDEGIPFSLVITRRGALSESVSTTWTPRPKGLGAQ